MRISVSNFEMKNCLSENVSKFRWIKSLLLLLHSIEKLSKVTSADSKTVL